MLATTTQQPGTRDKVLQQMDRLFADDRGLGVLVEFNGRPDMSEQDRDRQMAWADALIALHGLNRTASIYSSYANKRRAAEADSLAPVGSWDNLVLGTSPIPRWQRDLHDFLCVVCGESFPSVLIDQGQDPSCTRCARNVGVNPTQALPLWKAYSHHRFATPGVFHKEMPNGEATVTFTFDGGQTRQYVVGEAGLFYSGLSRLPGLVQKAVRGTAQDLDQLRLVLDASVKHDGKGFDITAEFSYDTEPEGSDGAAYGFRFVAASMAAAHVEPSLEIEYTDVYQPLDVMLTSLYAAPSLLMTETADGDASLPSVPAGEGPAATAPAPAPVPAQAPTSQPAPPSSDGVARAPEPSPRETSSSASATARADRSGEPPRLLLAATLLGTWAVCFAAGLLLIDRGSLTAAAAGLGGASVAGLALGMGLIRWLRRRSALKRP